MQSCIFYACNMTFLIGFNIFHIYQMTFFKMESKRKQLDEGKEKDRNQRLRMIEKVRGGWEKEKKGAKNKEGKEKQKKGLKGDLWVRKEKGKESAKERGEAC